MSQEHSNEAIPPRDLNPDPRILWLNIGGFKFGYTFDQLKFLVGPPVIGFFTASISAFTHTLEPLVFGAAISSLGLPFTRKGEYGLLIGDEMLISAGLRFRPQKYTHNATYNPNEKNPEATTQGFVGVKAVLPLYRDSPIAMMWHKNGTFSVAIKGNYGNTSLLSESEQRMREKAKITFLTQLAQEPQGFPIQMIERLTERSSAQYLSNLAELRQDGQLTSATDRAVYELHKKRVSRGKGQSKFQETYFIIASERPAQMRAKLQLKAKPGKDKSIIEELDRLSGRKTFKDVPFNAQDVDMYLVEQVRSWSEWCMPHLKASGFEPSLLTVGQYTELDRDYFCKSFTDVVPVETGRKK